MGPAHPGNPQAVCNHSGVKVVLKVYSLSRVAENALHTLVREVRIHTDLAHDNVLMMYGVFEVRTDKRAYLDEKGRVRGGLWQRQCEWVESGIVPSRWWPGKWRRDGRRRPW